MKIGIDISQIIHEGTGVGRYTQRLVQNLLKNDHENEYILFGYSLRKKYILDRFYNTLVPKKNVIKNFLNIPQSLLEIVWNRLHFFPIENFLGKIDLFHTSDWIEPPSKCKKITTIHDLSTIKYPDLFPKEIVKVHKRKLDWVVLESKAVITDSESTKQDCLNLLNIPRERIHVVYPGVDEQFTYQNENRIKNITEKYNIHKPYILSLGTREPRKNLVNVINAYNNLKKQYNLELVVVGKIGWGKDIAGIGKNTSINILGFVPDNDLPALYSGALCLVYPSLYEGFGFPILEAMRCGCPVVTSDKGSLKEVGGKQAIFVNPDNAESITYGIEKVLVDSKKIDKKVLIQWADKFSWNSTALKTLEIYQKVIE